MKPHDTDIHSSPIKRRVLIIVENLPVPFDRRVWSEATTLCEAGYLVSVICPKGKGYDASEETINGINVYRHSLPIEARGALGYLAEYSIALFWQLTLSIKVARRDGFDVMHACNPPDLIFIVWLFHRLFAYKRFVFDHHDANPEFYEAKFERRDFFWRLLLLFEKLTFKMADISIATNDSYREIALHRGGMEPNRVFVVRSGPNLKRVHRAPVEPRWRNDRKFMVGYVGVMSEAEGIDLLLGSVEYIVRMRRRDDIQFVLVGSGPQFEAISRLCETMKLNDYVTLTGRVDDNTLFTILSTADICVNPDRVTSMNDISTMNKIMEYMALGKPIVQFDVKEGRVSAETSSLYASPNDPIDFGEKILELIDDPERCRRMGEFGFRRVSEKLAWAHEQPKLLEAYEALFSLKNPRNIWYDSLKAIFKGRAKTLAG